MRKYSIDVHRVHHSVRLVVTLFVLLGFLIQNVAGSAYYSLLMEPYTTVTSPPVTLQAGTAGSSTIYTNSTSAKVSVVAPVPTPTYYPSGYSVSAGSYFSGSVPSSVQTVDTEYFIVKSSGSATSTLTYNPSNYALGGSTTLVSGGVSNLTSDNGVYMRFKSYASDFSTTSNTRAFIGYRSNTGTDLLSSPKSRAWNGSVWSAESEMITAGSSVRFVRVAYCPLSVRYYEKIVVTLSDDGYLDAYVWNGSSWGITNNIGSVGTTANSYRSFDIAYEKTNGRAILVYGIDSADSTKDLAYRIWNGTQWSSESYIDDTGHATDIQINWVALASKPTSGANEIALIYIDFTDRDVVGVIWNGSSWGNLLELESTVADKTREVIEVAYEQTSGQAMFVWGYEGYKESRKWSGSSWDSELPAVQITSFTVQWFSLKADPASNRLMLVCIDDQADLNTVRWDGSSWTLDSEHDGKVDYYSSRPAGFEWEPSGSKGLLVWGTASGSLSYKTFTAPSTWSSANTISATGYHSWVQLKRNSRDVSGDIKILGVMLNSDLDLGGLKWDGTTLTNLGDAVFTADTTVSTYECFEIEFQNFGDPTEFTSEVEFTGTSNTNLWPQLVWTVDSAWDASNVSVTLQLYNWTSLSYPNSGDGYIAYNSSGTTNTDETRTQTITTNPEDFRNATTGNWKIKVQGVKNTNTQFDFKADWIEFKPTYYSEHTVSTKFIFSGMTENTPTQLNFTVVTQYDTSSVNVTIQVWNYSSSAYATSGEGYSTYTSSGSNETTDLSINTNPQFYTSSGNAMIKVTGVLTTSSTYQQETNQIKLVYKYDASSTYDYVLAVTEQDAVDWKVNLTVYDSSNITRLSGTTISFYDGTTSDQIVVSGGVITQSEGPAYNLNSSTTIKIKMSNVDATSVGISYLYVYLKILVPETSTYLLYIITFEIT